MIRPSRFEGLPGRTFSDGVTELVGTQEHSLELYVILLVMISAGVRCFTFRRNTFPDQNPIQWKRLAFDPRTRKGQVGSENFLNFLLFSISLLALVLSFPLSYTMVDPLTGSQVAKTAK